MEQKIATLRMEVVERVGVLASGGVSREGAGPAHFPWLDELELVLSSIDTSLNG
jgi:hypothetical protein